MPAVVAIRVEAAVVVMTEAGATEMAVVTEMADAGVVVIKPQKVLGFKSNKYTWKFLSERCSVRLKGAIRTKASLVKRQLSKDRFLGENVCLSYLFS